MRIIVRSYRCPKANTMSTLPSEIPNKWVEQAAMLGNRLRKKHKLHRRWAKREEIEAYRLYDRDIPELPFAIDLYANHLHACAFERKEELDAQWIDWVLQNAAKALDIPAERLAIKTRARQKGLQQYEKQEVRNERFVIKERGHRFWVNLWDYLDTGLFLDHRETRKRVEDDAAGKRFLNLFAYTGSFGVYAAAGGADEVVQVDLSNTYLDWAAANLALNDFQKVHSRCVQSDTFAYLREAHERNERFDLVVIDPPTFSNSKRMNGTFDVKRDHVALLQATLDVLSPKGVIWFSTNARHFQLEKEAFAGIEIEDTTEMTVAPDFVGRHSHRSYRFRLP